MKVFISDIIREYDKYGSDYFLLIGQLQSGIEITVEDHYYDLQRFKGQHVEMLLSVMRSPYAELQRGIHNQIFEPEEFYSIELIDELKKEIGDYSTINKVIILTGEYIDPYIVPDKWIPFKTTYWLKFLLNKPPALKTDDGIYLLQPFHLKKSCLIEKFPRSITIATGCINLAAWHPLPVIF